MNLLHAEFPVYYTSSDRRYLMKETISVRHTAPEELPMYLLEQLLTPPVGTTLRSPLPTGTRFNSVTVENGTLAIETKDERTLRDYIGINFSTPEIRVYLPKAEYDSLVICENTGDVKIPDGLTFNIADISLTTGDVDFSVDACDLVKIKVSTGDIAMKNINVGALELTVSTGDVYITDAACESVTSKGSTGDIFLKNIIASKNISIERSTGDVKLDSTDGAEITVKTDTGNITGSLLTEKVFFAETNTGYVDVPKTVSGGKCEVKTDTGDIRITVIAS
jgi:DUF4097 and DUF4098 domain-containing protein YvlB